MSAQQQLPLFGQKTKMQEVIEHLEKFKTNGSNVGVMVVDGIRIETRCVLVTPELAEIILEYNTNNRKVKHERVNLYAKEMENGNWKFNLTPIKFSFEGILLDGQNRLRALIKSGRSFEFLIGIGLEPSTFDTMDVPGIRTVGDTAHVAGIKNPTVVGSVVRAAHAYKESRWSANKSSTRTISNAGFMDKHNNDSEAIDASVSFGVALHKKTTIKIMSAAELGTFHYLFNESDSYLAIEFLEKLFLGENLTKKSPIMLLRNLLLKVKLDKNYTLNGAERAKLIIHTWNLVKKGVKVTKLELPEDFDGEIL